MKQKDVALVIVIVFVSGVLSFFVSNTFISPLKQDQEAAVVEPITDEFIEPDKKYFNDQSINPTQTIRIDSNQNPNPFDD